MAENPVLIDLSGNGHDATCYNFGWSGMSGVGGYIDNVFTTGNNVIFQNFATLVSSDTVHITTSHINSTLGIGYWEVSSYTPHIRLEVTGKITDKLYISQYNRVNDQSSKVELKPGINDVHLTFSEDYAKYATLFVTSANKVTTKK